MTTSFSILNSGVVYFTTVVVYTRTYRRREANMGCACGAVVQFHNCGRGAYTRRSENECNSLKDANKQRRRLLHPETHKHEFPTPPPYPSYYCQRILILLLLLLLLHLILHFLGSIIINSAAAVPYLFAYITPVGIRNFSDIGLTRYTYILCYPTLKHTRYRRNVT